MILSNSQYSSLKSRLKLKYKKEFILTKKTLKGFSKLKIKTWIEDDHEELKQFSSLHWFFLKQIQLLLFFVQADLPQKTNEDGFTSEEDMVFEKWNQSEFAETFLKFISRGYSVKKSNNETIKIFDAHLVALGERHILKTKFTNKNYRLQTSLGDTKNSKLLSTTLHLEGKELALMTSTLKEMKLFSDRIEIALKVIKEYSPSSWDRFKAFTDLIIPIKQREFVSYSHQELPGTSMINLYHRDFVDLMDDLLHENGHHHLNYYLNLGTLIQEPIDTIYYSPWRRTLRPLRGIYHAYFTFFWAFKLFSDLASAKSLDNPTYAFSAQEKEKIHWRAVEEFWMLEYTYQDLVWAKKQGLIKETGWKLIKAQKSELNKFKKKIPVWEKKLKIYRDDLKDLKQTLKESRTSYRLN